jgi:hypothetical protein
MVTVRERSLCRRSREAISGDGEDYFYPPCGSLKAIVGGDSPLAARTIWRQLSQVKYAPADADFLLLSGQGSTPVDRRSLPWRTELFRFARLWRFSPYPWVRSPRCGGGWPYRSTWRAHRSIRMPNFNAYHTRPSATTRRHCRRRRKCRGNRSRKISPSLPK